MSQMRFSAACENNKQPILEQLEKAFANVSKVLEIGSGTGQHCAFFAPALAHLIWQPTDVTQNHASIAAWVDQANCHNVLPVKEFFIGQHEWNFEQIDGVFTANTAHIMQHNEVELMMQTISDNLPVGGMFCQYGPFNIDGQFTSQSNQQFDLQLRQQGCGGIVDIAQLKAWSKDLVLADQINLPANNMLLVWHR